MSKIILLTLLCLFYQQDTDMISPDGKFKLTVKIKEESDLRTRYIAILTDNESKNIFEVVNCVRRDLSAPNFYWDKDSKYLVYEQCAESFIDCRIKILNLTTKKTDFELTGLIGNKDKNQQQFDSQNDILIYFDTSTGNTHKIPDLYTLDIKTKKKRKIQSFEATMDMEFPELKRIDGKRKIMISYFNSLTGQTIARQLDY